MTETQNIVQLLSQVLSQGDELDRCCACRSLGVLGSVGDRSAAVNELLKHLRDDDIDVCIDAAESLGRLGDRAAVEPLIDSLRNDPDGDVKVAVVEALGKLGGEQAIAELITRAASAGEDSDWDSDEDWDSNWDIQRKAIQALGHLQARAAIDTLSRLLEEEDPLADETDVLLALARIGGKGEQVVIQRLRSASTRERRRAAHALGRCGSSQAARALGRALQDPQAEVRSVAAESLANSGQSQYLGALLLLLRDPAEEVRETALRAVNTLSQQAQTDLDIDKLLPLLNDPSTSVRAAALQTLQGQLPETLATDTETHILQLLQDPHPQVATAAIAHTPSLVHPEIDNILRTLLTHTQRDASIRRQAALSLGQRAQAGTETLLTLAQAINDDDTNVRWAALQALMAHHKRQHEIAPQSDTAAEQDPPPAPLALILATLRGEDIVNQPAAEREENSHTGPGQGSEKQTNDPLPGAGPVSHTVTQRDETEATQAHTRHIQTAGETDEETAQNMAALSTLEAILQSNQNNSEQAETNNPLSIDDIPELPDEEKPEFQPFYDLLHKQRQGKKKFYPGKRIDLASDVRLLSARILGDCSQPEAVKALQEMMQEDNPALQQEAINALARMPHNTPGLKETLGPLGSFLHLGTPDLQIASARALGAIGNLSNLASLQDCLCDPHPLLRSQALLALGQLLEKHTGKRVAVEKIPLSTPRQKKQQAMIDSALLAVSHCLNDNDVGVRKAAALSLAKLNKHPLNKQIRDDIIARLITAAYVGEGAQARDMGQALRALGPSAAGHSLIQHFNTLTTSLERRFALEMIEEVFRPQPAV